MRALQSLWQGRAQERRVHMHRSQGQTLEMNRCSSWKRTSCKPACIRALLQQRRLLAGCSQAADLQTPLETP